VTTELVVAGWLALLWRSMIPPEALPECYPTATEAPPMRYRRQVGAEPPDTPISRSRTADLGASGNLEGRRKRENTPKSATKALLMRYYLSLDWEICPADSGLQARSSLVPHAAQPPGL